MPDTKAHNSHLQSFFWLGTNYKQNNIKNSIYLQKKLNTQKNKSRNLYFVKIPAFKST